jgi:hypothetical protein
MPQSPGQSVFRLRIQLNEVDPVIWRRLLVPGGIRMGKLGDILLAAMGWSNSHLHAFTVGDVRYGMNADEFPEGEIDERTVTILQALRDQRRFTFDYDFGDSWEHDVVIEDLTWSTVGLKSAVCIDGANACPPDDVGGTWGYREFLEAIANSTHEDHEHYLNWVGGSFDPAEFDLGEINAVLQKIR